jgi:uncharacterized protein YigE (DUF2233 family)
MKKLFLFFLLVLSFVLVYSLVQKSQTQVFDEPEAASVIIKREVNYQDQKLLYEIIKVENLGSLILIPNFEEKSKSQDTFFKNNCNLLVNSGFYTEDDAEKVFRPLGLFISGGQKRSRWTANSLLDGVLSLNDFLTPRITRNEPSDNLTLAFQSGPILKENGKLVLLQIKNDKPERRMIAGVTGENKLYFLALYSESQNFAGPLLKDTPNILGLIETKEGLVFADALNLDGGTASAFITTEKSLIELTPVGSFLCEKKD